MIAAQQVLKEALSLSVAERAELTDHLLSSLDIPDEDIDNIMKKKVEYRVEAYRKGEIASVSLEEVLAKYRV